MSNMEIVHAVEDLVTRDDASHWFCPRSGVEDDSKCFDEDCLNILGSESADEKEKRQAKIRQLKAGLDQIALACKIYAFDGDDAATYWQKFEEKLAIQLTRCDICVREFHRFRAHLKTSLESEYEDDEVDHFLQKYDAWNIERISTNLDKASASLSKLDPQHRSINALNPEGMYAMFEALNCGPFLLDSSALTDHFDKTFQLVQTKRRVKLPSYAPGMAAFLFSGNEERSAWAHRSFSSMKRDLTASEFEYGVRPFLQKAMTRVAINSLEKDFLPTFWGAVLVILGKMTKQLVADNLCAMDQNLYMLALEHFQVDADHFRDEVDSLATTLELNPSAFWAALGDVNAQSVVDTILRAPKLRALLAITDETERLHLDKYFNWCLPFIRSIKPAHIVPPVRSLLHVLLKDFQKSPSSKYAQDVCWNQGLSVLLEAINMTHQLQGGPVLMHMIELISSTHIHAIVESLEGIEKKDEQRISEADQMALDIVEKSLALDVKALSHDRLTIQKTMSLDHDVKSAAGKIHHEAAKCVKPGHPALPAAILAGLVRLVSLEPFTEKQLSAVKTPHAREWNGFLQKLRDMIHEELLGRLDAFAPEQLVELFQEAKAVDGLIALLLSGDQHIHQAALNILKTLTGEDNRRDCIMHITKVFLNTTLDATAKALTLVAKQSAYTPCLTILKVCSDVFSCLCDSQDGVLRSDKELNSLDLSALENLWSKTWYILDMIFAYTESWSTLGYPKEDLADFCRATMDFADTTFDQYAVIANCLKDGAKSSNSESVGKDLLKLPKVAFLHISKWLRLRDDYLITRAVGLTSKILVRLQEVGIEIGAEAATFIEDVVLSTDRHAKVKTKLSMSQKAELQRALETHLGRSLADAEEIAQKKQTTIAGFARSGTSTPVSGTEKPKVGTIDVESWTKISERHKSEAAKRSNVEDTPANEAYKQRVAAPKKQSLSSVPKSSVKQQESFLAKRKAEKEAMEKAKAAMLAKQRLGAGTGVEGLGDMGKDHTTKGQNVMVSSSEDEDEDDESDIDVDLFGPSQKEKKKISRPDVDPKGAIGLRPEQKGPTKIRRTARSAKDMRARLAPDLQSLHKTILSWDFFFEGDYPPGANEHIFRAVNNTYMDSSTYQATFEPLLILEAWQGMVRTREEMERPKIFDVKIQNRSNVDSFIEISSLLTHQENKDLFLVEGDIVLFSKSAKEPHKDQSAPHCLARVYRMKRQKAHLEVVYQLMAGSTLTSALVPQAIIHGIKLQSIIPLEREYGALQGLQYYDLCNQIIRASPSSKMNFSEKQISAFQENWNVNRAQSEAINAAMENEGFSLIQGPPGSGKTKTIVAIVGGLLSPILAQSGGRGPVTKITAPNANNDGDSMPKKLLVCAPSNAAVDELVMRLKEGVKTRKGQQCPINIVRIGRSEAINQQVLDVTMDELVNRRLGNSEMDQKARERNAALFKDHEAVSARLRELYSKRDGGDVKGQEMTELEREISAVRKHKNDLGLRIDNAKDQEKNAGREQELNRKRAQQAILDQAHVICATLSGSGHDMFRTLNVEFETVIIDEAAQCVEMSSLIPLKYGCVKCIMVGDPKQLPPTVFSREAAKFQYEQSLFVRMQNNFPKGVYLLDTQYRMHPDISIFPSHAFYDDRLKDGKDMAALRKRPWHRSALLAPYRFFDVQGQHQKARLGGSLTNKTEVEVAMALYDRLTKDFADYDFQGRIGIITPYKSQLRMLKSEFVSRYGNDIFQTVEFNTTDAFQGRESEVIIFSCVRASPAGGIGFLRDIRRMNVGLTRAKSSLWVLGHSESLERGRYWKELIDDAKARDRFTSGDVMSMLRKPSSSYPAPNRSDANMRDAADVPSKPHHQAAPPKIKKEVKEEKNEKIERISPPPVESSKVKEETNTRMEGVTYRFQDRIAGKKTVSPAPKSDSDVDMHDALSDDRKTREMSASHSDRSTPQPQPTRQPEAKASAPIIRKRPAANPFMPAKKKFATVRK